MFFPRWDSFPNEKLMFSSCVSSSFLLLHRGKRERKQLCNGGITPRWGRAAFQIGRVHPQRAAGAKALKTYQWKRWGRTGSGNKTKKAHFSKHRLSHKMYFSAFSSRYGMPPVSALCLLAVQECQRTPSLGCQNQSVAKRHKPNITGV